MTQSARISELEAEVERVLRIAQRAIEALEDEEDAIQHEFGVGNPEHDFHERSRALRTALGAAVGDRWERAPECPQTGQGASDDS